MAKHRRRRFHGNVGFSLDGIPGIDKSVKGSDVLVGAVIGAAGAVGGSYGVGMLQSKGTLPAPTPTGTGFPTDVGSLLKMAAPLVGATALGAVAYFAEKKSAQGSGHLAGAIGAGLAIVATNASSYLLPAAPVSGYGANMMFSPGLGLLAADPSGRNQQMGLLAADPSNRVNDLASFSMSLDPDDAYEAVSGFSR